MRRWSSRLTGGAVLLLPGGTALACDASPGPAYVSLGDSIATGEGAVDAKTLGYAGVFHGWLQQNYDEDIELHNFAVNGETSATMREEGQLAAAVAFIRERNSDGEPANDVAVITIDIGGNDLRAVIKPGKPCAPPKELTGRECVDAITKALDGSRANIPLALRELRVAAGPGAIIIAANSYNPYSGSGGAFDVPLVDGVISGLNEIIEAGATGIEVDAEVAGFNTPFTGKSLELTGLATPGEDFHPNAAGHREMALETIRAFGRRSQDSGGSGD